MPSSASHTLAPCAFPIPEGQHWIDALDDGRHVLIRPLRPEDRDREKAFIENLSPAARRNRFLAEVKEANGALLDQLMDVDGTQRVAYVALAHDNGTLREIGISRYAKVADAAHVGEFAITVADDWQDKGLGALLMRRLIEQAKHNGFRQLYSVDAATNHGMRELASVLGMQRGIDPDDATQVIYTLAL